MLAKRICLNACKIVPKGGFACNFMNESATQGKTKTKNKKLLHVTWELPDNNIAYTKPVNVNLKSSTYRCYAYTLIYQPTIFLACQMVCRMVAASPNEK